MPEYPDDVHFSDVIDGGNDVFIDVDGKNVYKSTILKQICKEKPLSSDRLRKVRGLSKYVGAENTRINLNDVITNGDPLIIEHNKKMKVTLVVKIWNGDHVVDMLPSADLEILSTSVEVRELKLVEVGSSLFSTGEYASDLLKIRGSHCITVKPEISLNPPEGCSVFYFDKQLINDIGVHLTLQHSAAENDGSSAMPSSSSSSSDVKCKVTKCKKTLPLKEMRNHIGKHIVKGEIPESDNLCGFCGVQGCRAYLQGSSSGGTRHFNKPMSDCIYYYHYKKVGEKATRYTPCTNRIISCPICNIYIWSYNMSTHYRKSHDGEDTSEVIISQLEKNLLKNSKF